MTDNIEPWVTMKTVQENLGARRETITQWIGKQNMPDYIIGRQWKFKLSEVGKWVRSGSAADDDQTTLQTEEDVNA